jgi:hypothetical protein
MLGARHASAAPSSIVVVLFPATGLPQPAAAGSRVATDQRVTSDEFAARTQQLARAQAKIDASLEQLQSVLTHFTGSIDGGSGNKNAQPPPPPATSSTTLTPLNIGGFLAAAPPPLTCHAPVLDRSKYIPVPDQQRWTYNLHCSPNENQMPPPPTPYPSVQPLFHDNSSE